MSNLERPKASVYLEAKSTSWIFSISLAVLASDTTKIGVDPKRISMRGPYWLASVLRELGSLELKS
jgi:hypothetical protein